MFVSFMYLSVWKRIDFEIKNSFLATHEIVYNQF